MTEKRKRFILTIFTLDKTLNCLGVTHWDKDDFSDFLQEQEKHYGLKLHDKKAVIEIEYNNIIWNYQIYFGSLKKKYIPLETHDERWKKIEENIKKDLKTIGMESLYNNILDHLKNNDDQYYFTQKINKQFKSYCV